MKNRQWYIYLLVVAATFLIQGAASLPYALLLSSGKAAEYTGLQLTTALIPSAISLFALLLMIRYIHKGRAFSVVTSRKRLDIKRFFFGFSLWLLLSAAVTALSSLLHSDSEELVLTFNSAGFFKILLIGIILLPLQTGFEEVFFRGYLFKGLLDATKRPWLSVIVIAFIFATMHLANPEIKAYGFWVMVPQYLIMGLMLGSIAWLDKGLEVSIGVHFANNLFCLSFVSMDNSVLVSDSAIFHIKDSVCTLMDSVVLLCVCLIFIYLYRLFIKYGYRKVRQRNNCQSV